MFSVKALGENLFHPILLAFGVASNGIPWFATV